MRPKRQRRRLRCLCCRYLGIRAFKRFFGLGLFYRYYNYCPKCGKKITDKIIEKQQSL